MSRCRSFPKHYQQECYAESSRRRCMLCHLVENDSAFRYIVSRLANHAGGRRLRERERSRTGADDTAGRRRDTSSGPLGSPLGSQRPVKMLPVRHAAEAVSSVTVEVFCMGSALNDHSAGANPTCWRLPWGDLQAVPRAPPRTDGFIGGALRRIGVSGTAPVSSPAPWIRGIRTRSPGC
jgi:hypothetical protein